MTAREQSAKEQDLLARAARVLPAAGFGNFDPAIVIREGHGGRVWDESGREYIDFLLGSGPMLIGHGHPEVLAAVEGQIQRGLTFFANNAEGIALAEEICEALSCAEQLRYVSTGSEADMYAMRLVRAHRGREKILKFEGGYHGMSAEALMGLAPQRLNNFPQPQPDSAGLTEGVRDRVLVAPFNDIDFARRIIEAEADSLAGVILEPLQRLIPPQPGFLECLRKETAKHDIPLIFDEVVTGFRLAYGGAQSLYGVTPDLCTLGKAIGGGFPLAAIAGKAEIMAHFDKAKVGEEGFTYQVGTLSGNPVAAVAGRKTLEILRRPGSYEHLQETGRAIMQILAEELGKAGVAAQVVGHPALFDVVFTGEPVKDYRDVLAGDAEIQKRFNRNLRAEGILKADSKYYVSLAHNAEDLADTQAAIATAAAKL